MLQLLGGRTERFPKRRTIPVIGDFQWFTRDLKFMILIVEIFQIFNYIMILCFFEAIFKLVRVVSREWSREPMACYSSSWISQSVLRLLLKSTHHEASDCRLVFCRCKGWNDSNLKSSRQDTTGLPKLSTFACGDHCWMLNGWIVKMHYHRLLHPKNLLLPVSFGQIWHRSTFLHVLQHAQGEQPGAHGSRVAPDDVVFHICCPKHPFPGWKFPPFFPKENAFSKSYGFLMDFSLLDYPPWN